MNEQQQTGQCRMFKCRDCGSAFSAVYSAKARGEAVPHVCPECLAEHKRENSRRYQARKQSQAAHTSMFLPLPKITAGPVPLLLSQRKRSLRSMRPAPTPQSSSHPMMQPSRSRIWKISFPGTKKTSLSLSSLSTIPLSLRSSSSLTQASPTSHSTVSLKALPLLPSPTLRATMKASALPALLSM